MTYQKYDFLKSWLLRITTSWRYDFSIYDIKLRIHWNMLLDPLYNLNCKDLTRKSRIIDHNKNRAKCMSVDPRLWYLLVNGIEHGIINRTYKTNCETFFNKCYVSLLILSYEKKYKKIKWYNKNVIRQKYTTWNTPSITFEAVSIKVSLNKLRDNYRIFKNSV